MRIYFALAPLLFGLNFFSNSLLYAGELLVDEGESVFGERKSSARFICHAADSSYFTLQHLPGSGHTGIRFASKYPNISIELLGEALGTGEFPNNIIMFVSSEASDCAVQYSSSSILGFDCAFGPNTVDFALVSTTRLAKNLVIRSLPSSPPGTLSVRMTMDIFDRESGLKVDNYNETLPFTQCNKL